jgi:hypothetical protein
MGCQALNAKTRLVLRPAGGGRQSRIAGSSCLVGWPG